MASIKCKACGKRYSYHESDLCPHCGAYNKPSSRMRVDFDKDGNAELLHEQEFLRQSKAGKQREKVCYERKECHEDQVRPKSETPQSSPLNAQQLTEKMKEFSNQAGSLFSGKRDEKKGESQAGVALVIFIVLILLRACMASL